MTEMWITLKEALSNLSCSKEIISSKELFNFTLATKARKRSGREVDVSTFTSITWDLNTSIAHVMNTVVQVRMERAI